MAHQEFPPVRFIACRHRDRGGRSSTTDLDCCLHQLCMQHSLLLCLGYQLFDAFLALICMAHRQAHQQLHDNVWRIVAGRLAEKSVSLHALMLYWHVPAIAAAMDLDADMAPTLHMRCAHYTLMVQKFASSKTMRRELAKHDCGLLKLVCVQVW